jgi:hypothetical protein
VGQAGRAGPGSSGRFAINQFTRLAVVVQIPHAQERKFNSQRDGKFAAPPTALFGL